VTLGTHFAIVVICALPRLAALVVANPPETQYSALARSLADAHRYVLDGLATARIEPLCPALFALGRMLFPGAAWHMLIVPLALASVSGVALFSLTGAATNSMRAAWFAVLLYALSPYLVRQSASFMEVTLATALLILAAWRMRIVATTAHGIAIGLLFAAIVLTRFSFLPIAIGGVLLVWRRENLARAATAASVTAMCVAPWLAYSHATDGSFWPTRIGENLYVSTSEWARGIVPRINADVLVPLATASVAGENDPDGTLLRRALVYSREHPATVASLKLRNLLYVVQPRLLPFTERVGSASIVDGRLVVPEQRPRPVAYEWIAGMFQAVLLGGGAVGLWLRRDKVTTDDAFVLIVLVAVAGVSVVFFPTSRLLAPMSFVLMFYTTAAIVRDAR